jgi:hypothetical protein
VDAGDINNCQWELTNFGIWASMPIVPKLNHKTGVSQGICSKKQARPSLQMTWDQY